MPTVISFAWLKSAEARNPELSTSRTQPSTEFDGLGVPAQPVSIGAVGLAQP